MTNEKLIKKYIEIEMKKNRLQEKIRKRFTDESGEGFEDGGTIFFVIGLLMGLFFVEICITGGNRMLTNFLNKAQQHINSI